MPDRAGRNDDGGAGAHVSRTGAVTPGRRTSEGGVDEISLVRLLNVLLRHRRLVLGLPIVVALLVVAVTLVLPRTFTAEAAFLPETGERDPSRLAGLAAQFGFSLPVVRGGESSDFYADLLRSRELLKAAIETRYDLGSGGGSPEDGKGTLVAYYGLEGEPREVGLAKAVERLREDLRIRTRQETGVVELAVTTSSPVLSHQVAERLLALVNVFNLERRQSQAAAERGFIQARLRQTEAELEEAEDSLQTFLQANRRYENSPELVFEHDRLQRRVSLRQEVFTSLSQSYEQARIEEVRNTPVITVVDPPEAPARPDRRRIALKALLGLLLGGMLGVFWAFGGEFFAVAREEEPDDYSEFERLKGQTVTELRGLWRRVRRPFAGSGRSIE